jgi:hypothetical protein
MLKKITADSDVEQLRPGDYIFDNPYRQEARNFKIKKIIYGYVLAFYGGDFPSLKLLSKSTLINGSWWMEDSQKAAAAQITGL